MQCTGTSKRSGEQCKKDARPGTGVCHMHGSKSRKGPASGTWKHGKNSKWMTTPDKLREGYERACAPPLGTGASAASPPRAPGRPSL